MEGTSRRRQRTQVAERTAPGAMRLVGYAADRFEERVVEAGELADLARRRGVVWVDVERPDAVQIEALGRAFGLHPLTLADLARPPQRPKFASHPTWDFFVLAAWDEGRLEQVGLFVGEGWVLTVRESRRDPFEPVRRRLRDDVVPIRARGAGWLGSALVTEVVDDFFDPVEELRERMEEVEAALLVRDTVETFTDLRRLGRRLAHLRRTIGPLHDAIVRSLHEATPRWDPDALLHLREAAEDSAQLVDAIQAAQLAIASLGDLHLSVLGTRTNEVMSLLTLVSTLFLPLTFLAGVWGMNFWFMPEIPWRRGYLFAWIAFAVAGAGMFLLFRNRGWLRALRSPWSSGRRHHDDR